MWVRSAVVRREWGPVVVFLALVAASALGGGCAQDPSLNQAVREGKTVRLFTMGRSAPSVRECDSLQPPPSTADVDRWIEAACRAMLEAMGYTVVGSESRNYDFMVRVEVDLQAVVPAYYTYSYDPRNPPKTPPSPRVLGVAVNGEIRLLQSGPMEIERASGIARSPAYQDYVGGKCLDPKSQDACRQFVQQRVGVSILKAIGNLAGEDRIAPLESSDRPEVRQAASEARKYLAPSARRIAH